MHSGHLLRSGMVPLAPNTARTSATILADRPACHPALYFRSDFTACLALPPQLSGDDVTVAPSASDARTLFRRAWANKSLGDLTQAGADFESARLLEPLHPYLSVDYRNIFDTELVVIDDEEPFVQTPAVFHRW